MKILAICQYYSPEPMRFTDICEALVERGHSVTVVTGVPNYPEGEIYPDYRGGQRRKEKIGGVEVLRYATVPRKTGTLFRILNYFSFAISSWLKIGKLADDYDVVLINQMSPVMMCWPGFRYARKHNKKCVMYCMDLWPASLAAGEIKEDSLIYKVFKRISKRIYRRADKILITSRMFQDYFDEQFNITGDKIEYLPQYADSQFEEKLSSGEEKSTVDLMFAGNIGAAQSIYTILGAAELLKEEKNVFWHIVGDGSELKAAKNFCTNLNLENVIFYGRRPIDEMPELYSKADAMIVTLTGDPFISMTLPGKVQTYMAAGKPILAAARGEIPSVLSDSGCGLCCEADNAEAFAELVKDFIKSTDKKNFALKARAYYEANFTRRAFVDKLELALKEHCK